ncbi:hypothetical protein ACFYKX_20270 [Cytobacillus sp. FJAT-54145]|uniref:Uncharacterized protein n=1 Tax=Cytobacillus spartinae TaxID=3299023 RepID=A0ABW6KJQ3_9BACI
MGDKNEKSVPNVSGSFQIVGNQRQDSLKEVQKEKDLDDESLYYARLFMED